MERQKFREWIRLENLRQKITEAAIDQVGDLIYSYLNIAVSDRNWDEASWLEVADKYLEAQTVNAPTLEFPILLVSKDKNIVSWDYEGRDWYLWANLLASAYSWTLEYISEMDVDDAIGMVQEILSDEVSKREFFYGLSEIAYTKDYRTKSVRYNPFPKPNWMITVTKIREPEIVKIPKSLIPVGNVIRWDQREN